MAWVTQTVAVPVTWGAPPLVPAAVIATVIRVTAAVPRDGAVVPVAVTADGSVTAAVPERGRRPRPR